MSESARQNSGEYLDDIYDTILLTKMVGFCNSVDNQLNSVDTNTTKYAYKATNTIYQNTLLVEELQKAIIEYHIHPCRHDGSGRCICKNDPLSHDFQHLGYHTYECTLLNNECICKPVIKSITLDKHFSLKKTSIFENLFVKLCNNNDAYLADIITQYDVFCKNRVDTANGVIIRTDKDRDTIKSEYKDNIVVQKKPLTDGIPQFKDVFNLIYDIMDVMKEEGQSFKITLDQFKMLLKILINQIKQYKQTFRINAICKNLVNQIPLTMNDRTYLMKYTNYTNNQIDQLVNKIVEMKIDNNKLSTNNVKIMMNISNRSKQNVYILDSPTGTGKTINFLYSQFLTRVLQSFQIHETQSTGVSTLIFANTDIVSQQTAKRLSTFNNSITKTAFVEVIITNDMPSLVISTFRKRGRPGNYKWEQQPILMLTMDKTMVEDSTKSTMTILKILSPEYKCHYIANTRYQYINQFNAEYIQLADNYILKRYMQVINKPQKLVSFNVTDYINAEFDVLCLTLQNYQFLNMFGLIDIRSNIQTVVFDEVDVFYSTNTLDEFYKFYFSQLFMLTAVTVIFASATIKTSEVERIDTYISPVLKYKELQQLDKQIESICIQEQHTQVFTLSNVYTTTTIQDLARIIDILWQQGNAYFYFDIDLKPIPTLQSYCKLTVDKLTVKTREYRKQYSIKIQDKLLDHLKPFKRVFVTNRLLRNQHFSQINPVNTIEMGISTIKELNMIRKFYIHEVTLTQQFSQINMNVHDIITNLDSYIRGQSHNKKTLLVTLSDNFITKQIHRTRLCTKFTQVKDPISMQLYDNLNKMQYYKLNEKTPFNEQRLSQLSNQQFGEPVMATILYDDFISIGRGLDIDGLVNVIIIIPMHYDFNIIKFSKSELTQIMGRVGRFGNPGRIYLLKVIIDITDIDPLLNAKSTPPNATDILLTYQQELIDYINIGLQCQLPGITKDLQDLLKANQDINNEKIKDWTTNIQAISNSIGQNMF